MKYIYLKKVIDFGLALILIILCLPILIFTAVLISIFLDKKFIFKQQRIGRGEKIFNIYKFRTMSNLREGGKLLPDEKRLTRIGKIIRKYSLDELPQLINILKGEMSFVGPRPLLPEYLPYYTTREKVRHDVTPGITGLAQINGRNSISWDKKLYFDILYKEKIGFFFDLKIIAHTVIKVLKGSDVSAEGHATMPRLSDIRKIQN